MSLLAGRIFFKGVRYHGRNETIIVHDGYITWRYWLRHVQRSEWHAIPEVSKERTEILEDVDYEATRGSRELRRFDPDHEIRQLPCRILLKARGVEWFIYNRSPAYDALYQTMQSPTASAQDRSPDLKATDVSVHLSPTQHRHNQTLSENGVKSKIRPDFYDIPDNDGHVYDADVGSKASRTSTSSSPASEAEAPPQFLCLLPIGIECSKGAIVMGNRNTRSILTAKFDRATGKIDAKRSGPLDFYKQSFDFDAVHPIIQFKQNRDYTGPQVNQGEKLHTSDEKPLKEKGHWADQSGYPHQNDYVWAIFRKFGYLRRGSVGSFAYARGKKIGTDGMTDQSAGAYGQNRWLGLTRYLDDEDDVLEQERWKAVEYGQYSTIVDSPKISICLFWDVPGRVPDGLRSGNGPQTELEADINGDAPPDWGIELKIGGGTIHYGPWADRQRADLQAVFFPTPYKDASAADRLSHGDYRLSTVMRVVIDIEEQTTVRVPTREESKDWRWRGRKIASATAIGKNKKVKHGKRDKRKNLEHTPEERPFGWIDAKIMPNSTVSFKMDLVARLNGYQNFINLGLKGLEISSSINHGLLWRSKSQSISCDLLNPLGWNALRKWQINIHDDGLELFMIRDHMFLLTDLINDWTTGPPGDFHTFIPFEYSLGLKFTNLSLYLNANDSNIINNPSDFDDNTFIVFSSEVLTANLTIPMGRFRPARNQVAFKVDVRDSALQLRVPPRNTQQTFLDDCKLASLKILHLDGSYDYFTSTASGLTDSLLINIHGLSPKIHLHGFLVRYFMKVKDNYFGDDIHFRTLEEYQDQVDRASRLEPREEHNPQHTRLSNDLDVVLVIRADDLVALLPAYLYSSRKSTKLEVHRAMSDLRITNYYMDLAVSTSPIAISSTKQSKPNDLETEECSSTQVSISGLDVFGHRLFGLPPTEPTYVCNWDFDLGHITGQCSIDFLQCLMMSLKSFGLTFDDAENALPALNPTIIHDVTFLRARLRPVQLGISIDEAAFLVTLDAMTLTFNDWADVLFSEHLHLNVPNLTLTVADRHGVSTSKIAHDSISTHAYLSTAIDLHMVNRKPDFERERHLQQSHVALNDSRTHRVPWLIHDSNVLQTLTVPAPQLKTRPPAMPYPFMPQPLLSNAAELNDGSSSVSATTESRSQKSMSSRKSSFLINSGGDPIQRQGPKVNPCNTRHTRKQPSNVDISTDTHSANLDRTSPSVGSFGTSRRHSQSDEATRGRSDARNNHNHNGLSFSSPYKQPHFPLLGIRPDTRDVPELPNHRNPHTIGNNSGAAETTDTSVPSHNASQASFIVKFSQGAQIFCDPKALFLVNDMLTGLQVNDGAAVLDELQFDSMTDVLHADQRAQKKSQTVDLRIVMPSMAVRFVNEHVDTRMSLDKPSTNHRQERYDLSLSDLTATVRSSIESMKDQESAHLTLHVQLNRLEFSAREVAEIQTDDQAIVSISVTEPIFWMTHGTKSAADIQLSNLAVVSASRKVDYISSLIEQTLILSDELQTRFTKLESDRKLRIRLLVLLIAMQGGDIPDPPFLTRVSYVLRSASRHLRMSDSWKMMSRLRYIYQNLSEQSRHDIDAKLSHDLFPCPRDAGKRVLAKFDHWGTIESVEARNTALVRRVYGDTFKVDVQQSAKVQPIKLASRVGTIEVLVEPGPNQNEIAVQGLTVGLSLDKLTTTDERSLAGLHDVLVSTIQVHCTEVAVRLNWTLLGLLESIVGTIQGTTILKPKVDRGQREKRGVRHDRCLHVVISSDLGVLNCNTPNLKIVSLCQAIRVSSATVTGVSSPQDCITTTVFNADKAMSEVKTHLRMLSSYQLQQPRVFASKKGDSMGGILEPWKVVGTGREAALELSANPLQLIEAADCFLEQEVAHVLEWIKSLQSDLARGGHSGNTARKTSLAKIQVALSLDSYFLSLKVLPSLTYQIAGSRVGTIVKSALHGKYKIAIDLSLKEHSHRFKTKETANNVSGLLSELHMPPINGVLGLDLAPHQKQVDFRSFIEDVKFDATAVHAILSAISRPEIISLGTSIKREVSLLQSHYNTVFHVKKQDVQAQPQSTGKMLYNVNMGLSGLAIRARTSESSAITPGAALDFKMKRLHMTASNSDSQSSDTIQFPEIDIQFNSIVLELLRFSKETSDPISCGNLVLKTIFKGTQMVNDTGNSIRAYELRSNALHINVYAETAPVVVAVLVHLQDTLKTFDLSQEVQNLRKLKRARSQSKTPSIAAPNDLEASQIAEGGKLFNAMYSLEMTNVCVVWRIESSISMSPGRQPENLILSLTKIDLATRQDNAARLLIENLQLQMVPISRPLIERSSNSALLPEVVFNVAYISTEQDRRLAFQAVGKSLDLRLTSQFVLPASDLRRSIALSIQQVRTLTADWKTSENPTDGQEKQLFGNKKLASLLVDADFAGAVVHIQGQSIVDPHSTPRNVLRGGQIPDHGRYDHFGGEHARNSSTTLKAPGIAFKVEYKNISPQDLSLNAEMRVTASTNILYPTVVPLIMEISSSVKDIVGDSNEQSQATVSTISQPKFLENERIRGGDPSAIFGHCRLNLGLQICRQEFSLSCQPIARVAATARFEDIYITINTVQSSSHGKFFTISGTFTRLQASVQHMYSRESTGSFEVDSIIVSLMNSKHISKTNGISAILRVSPMKAQVNGKQSQDFLLFREIWIPTEVRGTNAPTARPSSTEPEAFIVQRYQQIAATGAFPWNATISIAELNVDVDLGQSLGKSTFAISQLWVSSKKSSNWEQNLCLGFTKMAIDSVGRMSGIIELQDMRMRTSIRWPMMENAHTQTPLVQGSLAFDHLRVKAAFDYQAFAIADIESFKFLMYNVRDAHGIGGDRLVGMLDGGKVQAFCTTTSASQGVALYQAFQRLYQEKMTAYETSLRDIEKLMRRKSSINPIAMRAATAQQHSNDGKSIRSMLKLQTDVVISLKAINIGAFPGTFFDNQIFKLEALDASARFAVVVKQEKIHSTLCMTLGQLRVALSNITRASVPKTLGEVSIADVVSSATGSRGGTILKVPRLVATMETWQAPDTTNIEYIFESTFQGKVDVGWNYSRISYIRGMASTHARALAQRLGKPLPQSAVQIKGVPQPEGDEGDLKDPDGKGGKITAVVNVPQSKYQYTALRPAIIDTPQLRDMGEATPPLEWIGLHREKLPNLTHQIVIVSLLEVAKEVDDAYSRILGSS